LSELARIVEALLFLSPDPVATADLAEAAECDADELAVALAELDRAYAPGERGLQLKRVAGGVALATDPRTRIKRDFTDALVPECNQVPDAHRCGSLIVYRD